MNKLQIVFFILHDYLGEKKNLLIQVRNTARPSVVARTLHFGLYFQRIFVCLNQSKGVYLFHEI